MAASGDGAAAAESHDASSVDDFEMSGGGNRRPRQDTSDTSNTLSLRAVWNIEIKGVGEDEQPSVGSLPINLPVATQCGSAIDAGFYTHADSEYVQNMGWDPMLVNELYEWVETGEEGGVPARAYAVADSGEGRLHHFPTRIGSSSAIRILVG
ncbi:Glucose-methanol-choline oxidoreductase family protein [Perilla frutescens var. hirtella]|nr:Glucose-methanol-choline oxidoreductase family protein [Perilla frutescens var. hirtella]